MKRTITYPTLNGIYVSGSELITINEENFTIEVEDDGQLSDDELAIKYRDQALSEAAYRLISDYSDFIYH